ncbi:DUF2474 family protein [Roseovarius sp.]|nr:DUF2474 family protein [Roseovarius sp.]
MRLSRSVKRLLWFAFLWLASVATLAVIAMLIKLAMPY